MASFYVDTLVYAHVLYNGMLQVSLMKSKERREDEGTCISLYYSADE